MSDEHNKPENSSATKARPTRRPAASKAKATAATADTTEAAATASTVTKASPTEKTPADASTAKPSRGRAPRKSVAEAPAKTSPSEDSTVTTPAPKKSTPRPTRKTAPKSATTTAEQTSATPALGTDAAGAVATNKEEKTNRRVSTARKTAATKSSKSAAVATAPLGTAQTEGAASDTKIARAALADKPVRTSRPRNAGKATAKSTGPSITNAPEISAATTSAVTPLSATASDTPSAQPLVAEHANFARGSHRNAPAQPATQRKPSEASSDNAQAAPASVDADTQDAEEGAQAAPRKSRRGRRGGRGRSRKGRQATQDPNQDVNQDVAQDMSNDAFQTSADDADMDMDDLDDGAPNYDADLDADPDADPDANPDANHDAGRSTQSEAPSRGRGAKRETAKRGSKAKEKEVEADSKPGRRKMFISVVPGEQVEVALVEEGVIGEYYLDMLNQAKTKGNIYKGVVHNVDPNLQAAFVSYGAHKNGFLQIDEIHPEYYLAHHEAAKGKKFPPIQKVIKPGQEVLVQVVKEPTGNKGAFLTTWLSLAGRFLVLTPGQEQIGVSRKVDNDEERTRLREMMNGIEPGEGLGVIVRTVSAGTSKTTLKNDLQYLKRVWKEIRRRGTAEIAPSLVYQESSLAERAVRDYLTEDVCEVWVDNETVAESLRETVALLFPRKEDLVRVHVDVRQTLWERFNIQRQLEQIYSREVNLPSGGRLVFDQTEALMAIDINSGKISGKANFESMALKTNIEAAEAIARHLKLRDIGGQVVIDFIEMRDKSHVREVEKTLRNAMKNDRARHDVARMSSFGLLEIVRQRTGSSALAVTMEPCPCCNGTGIRRNMEWQSLQALRQIGRQARIPGTTRCVFESNTELGMYLLNHKRDRLREMEQQINVPIEIRIQP